MAIIATFAGICPKSALNTTVYNAESSCGSIVWIKEQGVIKRLRVKLAERGHKCIITRIGTAAHRERGAYVVHVADRQEVPNADL